MISTRNWELGTRNGQTTVCGQGTLCAHFRVPLSAIRNPKSAMGFNLVEVMFSIMILGVGLIAIASLFPVAGALQQRTMDDVDAYHAKLNAITMLNTTGIGDEIQDGLENDSRADQWKASGEVFYWRVDPTDPGTDGLFNYLNIADRTFPLGSANPQAHWVPLFRWDEEEGGWEVHIFMVKATEASLDGGEVNLQPRYGHERQPGEFYLDNRSDIERSNTQTSGSRGRYYREKDREFTEQVTEPIDEPLLDPITVLILQPGQDYWTAPKHGRNSTFLRYAKLGATDWSP